MAFCANAGWLATPTCQPAVLEGISVRCSNLNCHGKESIMKIGIIGAGNIGSALTRHFTRLGHDVVVANSRGPETLSVLAKETGARAVQVSEVPRGRDLV